MKQDRRLAAMIVARAPMKTAEQPMKKGPSPDDLHREGDSSNGPNDKGEEAGESMEGHHAAAKEMMEAVKAGDHEGLATAMKNFYEMCKESET